MSTAVSSSNAVGSASIESISEKSLFVMVFSFGGFLPDMSKSKPRLISTVVRNHITWTMNCVINDEKSEYPDHLAMHLFVKGHIDAVQFTHTKFRIVPPEPVLSTSIVPKTLLQIKKTIPIGCQSGWGSLQFLKKASIWGPHFASLVHEGGILKIEVQVTINASHFTNRVQSDFMSRMSAYFQNSTFSDLTLITTMDTGHNKEYPVHKIILSLHSKVLRKLFRSNMRDAKAKSITITEYTDEEVKGMLAYMYSPFVIPEYLLIDPVNLFLIAHFYEVTALMEMCTAYMSTSLTEQNVIEYLRMADKYICNDLKKAAMTFVIDNNMSDLTKLRGYEDLESGLYREMFVFMNGNYEVKKNEKKRKVEERECIEID